MAGAGGTGADIRRPPSPDRGVPGLVGRLLQRTASSTNASKRFYRRSTGSTVAPNELLLSEKDENQSSPTRSRIPAVAADHQQTRSTAPDAGDIAQPQPQHTGAKPTAAPNVKMPSATPQPQLKKKASFKDRLKAWQKPPQPLEMVAEELKPRFVYEPKHAAADFSRLAVSPLSPSRQRLPPAMQIRPGEDAPVVPHNVSRRPRDGAEPRERAPRDEEPTRRHSRPSANRYSYPLVDDPFQASNAAAHVPVNARPVAWTPGAQAAGWREDRPSPSQPPSDFELFIARAEAEDRERREHVLRSMSQRSAAYPANRVRPDPHRQFAAAASSSAGRTAERSDGSGQRTSGTRYVIGSGSGSAAEQQPQRQERRQEGRRGHARQSSWAASYATSGSAAGQGLERKLSQPSQPQAPAQQRGPPEPQQPIVYCVDDEFGPGREYQPQPPRTLRRQASLTQRIVQYIRPPKTAGRPVGTLVE